MAKARRTENFRAVTIRHVAAEAGTSIATVSHVLNGTRPVGADLRQRVLDAATRLGFHANPAARGLRAGNGPIIEIVVPSLKGSAARLITGAAQSAQAQGARLVVTLPAASSTDPEAEFRNPIPAPVNAVIYAGVPVPRHARDSSGPPVVECLVGPPAGAGVILPLEAAVETVAFRFIQRGHCLLALLWTEDPEEILSGPGFRTAAEAGLARALRRFGLAPRGNPSFGGGSKDGMPFVFDSPPALRPSGLIAATSTLAEQVIREAADRGLKTPGSAVVACLDGETTVGAVGVVWPWEAIGKSLARAALDEIRSHGPRVPPHCAPFTLTAAPPGCTGQ